MSYFDVSLIFLILPILIIVYNFLPKKLRPILLLIFSFSFFFYISKGLIIYLILSIISIYIVTNILDIIDEKYKSKKDAKKKKKLVLIIGILFNVSFLFYFKYLNFFETNINYLFNILNIKTSFNIQKIIAPIGISFYTLEALSYMIDVYYKKIKADKNIIRVGLFLSFFPKIMEGPISRYSDAAENLYKGKKITYNNFCFGFQRILYGFVKKMIIADRLNFVVSKIFDNYQSFNGVICLFGIISYTVMLYMEFSGTMDVAIGIGEIFNVNLPENFRQPFFSKNISEFWTRWHITLGKWFKDYIFYPISLSKKMKKLTLKLRKKLGNYYGPLVSGSISLFTVWLLNGLWHGAGWTYLFFGLYHFTMILLGNLFEPSVKYACKKLKINRNNTIYRIIQSVKMSLLVFIGEIFFRAKTLEIAIKMLNKIFTNFDITNTLNDKTFLKLGLDINDYLIIIITLSIIFVVGLLKEKNINIRKEINKKNIIIRWIIYYILILSIIVFGAYGPGYIPVDPIYADF